MSHLSYRLVIALLVGIVLGMACSNILSSNPVAAEAAYSHFYLGFGCQSANMKTSEDFGVLDLRNGNKWCVSPGEAWRFTGTISFATIPEKAPK